MKLNVGCGHHPLGCDVNVDLFVEATAHRSVGADQRRNTDVPLKHIPNLIKADCCHLPFQSNIFDVTISNHLIEHIDEPLDLLKEMVRVTKPDGKISVTTPHKLSHNKKWILHKHSFNFKWFEKAFKVLNVELTGSRKNYRYFPFDYFTLFRVPYFIQVTGRVKK